MESSFLNPVLSEELPGHAGVRLLTLYSRALRRRGDVTLCLPPGSRDRAMPLLLLLHGVRGSHWNWWALGGLPEIAAQMIANGEMEPMAIAMPSDGLWSDGSVQGIAGTITAGVSQPKKYRAPMPAMGGTPLSADQVNALSAYVWGLSHRTTN